MAGLWGRHIKSAYGESRVNPGVRVAFPTLLSARCHMLCLCPEWILGAPACGPEEALDLEVQRDRVQAAGGKRPRPALEDLECVVVSGWLAFLLDVPCAVLLW